MSSFKDAKGREWDIPLNISTTMRLKADGVKFHELAENKYQKFLALETDDEAFAALLWAIVKPQAKSANVTQEDFYEGLYGESFFGAWEAFRGAYVNFTRSPEIRSALTKAFERSRNLQDRAAKIIEAKYKRLEEIGEAKIAELTQEMNDEKMTALINEHIESSKKNSAPPTPSDISSALPVG